MAPYNSSVSASRSERPLVLSRPEHPVSRSNIDSNAIKVLYRLHHGGFKSYLVGGAVRDLMLGRSTALTELPLVTTRPGRLPPEPLRRLVLDGAQRMLQRIDDGAAQGPLARLALRVLQ